MHKVHEKINDLRGNLITVTAPGVSLGELAIIKKKNGTTAHASVLKIEDDLATLQVHEHTRGISTGDSVRFLGHPFTTSFSDSLMGRRFNGSGDPIDGAPGTIEGEQIPIGMPSFNPTCRVVPSHMIRTNIPMIDIFNCLVKSQKIPIFSVPGEPYNELLMRLANQAGADIVIIGGMGLRFDDYQSFVDNAEKTGSKERTIMFIHQATDPPVECLLVPDMALAVAEKFALEGKNVLVLLTDMTAFADAIKEIAITMDQIPAYRNYPGSLYSDLASRYEKAVEIRNKGGAITIITVTTMPGNDETHPVPDNTGYITEGQFYLINGRLDPHRSLSRLKQLVIGKEGMPKDHGDLANALIGIYTDALKARERRGMGFKPTPSDEQLLKFASLFEDKLMSLQVNIPLEEALRIGWHILAECFRIEEVGIKKAIKEAYWPRERELGI